MDEPHIGAGFLVLIILCGYTVSLYPENVEGHKDKLARLQDSYSRPPIDSVLETSFASSQHSQHHRNHRDNPAFLQALLQLCHPHGRQLAGLEGLPPQGTVLEKAYFLIVGATGHRGHTHLEGHPAAPVNCHFAHHAGQASMEKVRAYPQTIQDFKRMRRSKSGLHLFEMLPSAEDCSSFDVAPWDLSKMIELGQFLAEQYHHVLPFLRAIGKDPVQASCIPDQDFFQSTAALLHGLLHEKQFMRADFTKLDRLKVRGLRDHRWCSGIARVEDFVEQAYMEEHELFQDRVEGVHQQKHLYESLEVEGSGSGKKTLESLSRWFCQAGSAPCHGEKCVNLEAVNVSMISQMISKHNAYLSSNALFQSYAYADTHLHLKDVLSWFEGGEGDPKSDGVIKIDLINDFFFLKVLTSLGHQARDPIVPGSRLVIEQYRKAKSKGDAKFWRVLVDGRVVTDTLGSCWGTASKGFCGLDTVKAWLKEKWKNSSFGVCAESREEL